MPILVWGRRKEHFTLKGAIICHSNHILIGYLQLEIITCNLIPAWYL